MRTGSAAPHIKHPEDWKRPGQPCIPTPCPTRVGVPLQLRLAAAVVVFVGSYLPLSLILLVQDFDYGLNSGSGCWPLAEEGPAGPDVGPEAGTRCVVPLRHPGASLGFAATCGVCFAVTAYVLRITSHRAKVSIVISRAKHVPSELMSYALPYIAAFMDTDYEAKETRRSCYFSPMALLDHLQIRADRGESLPCGVRMETLRIDIPVHRQRNGAQRQGTLQQRRRQWGSIQAHNDRRRGNHSEENTRRWSWPRWMI